MKQAGQSVRIIRRQPRSGTVGLELGPRAGIPHPDAIIGHVQLAREQDLADAGPEEGATEGFPPPRLVLDTDTSRLYIADVSRPHQPKSRQSFVPVEQYIEERAQLFVEAFRAAR